jgi:hypothetical protein
LVDLSVDLRLSIIILFDLHESHLLNFGLYITHIDRAASVMPPRGLFVLLLIHRILVHVINGVSFLILQLLPLESIQPIFLLLLGNELVLLLLLLQHLILLLDHMQVSFRRVNLTDQPFTLPSQKKMIHFVQRSLRFYEQNLGQDLVWKA